MAKKKEKKVTPKEEKTEVIEEKIEIEKEDNKLGKIKIIIIIIVGLLFLCGSFLISYNAAKDIKIVEDQEEPKKEKKKDKKEEYLKVGKYKLKYGTYKGIEEEYDPDTDKTIKMEIKIELNKDKMIVNGNSMNYKVKDDNYIYINEVKMYEVTANNEFTLIAGAGIDFEYVK